MITFNKPYATISYDAILQSIKIEWKDYVNFEQYKEVLEEAFKTVEGRKCMRWISDMRKGQAVPKEAREWLQKEFIPRAAKTGVKKVAFLLEKNIFRKMYAESITTSIEFQGLIVQTFDNENLMNQWLMEKGKVKI